MSNLDGTEIAAIVIPAALAGGWIAGAITARFIVRREIEKLHLPAAGNGAAPPQPVPEPVRSQPLPAPIPQPQPAPAAQVSDQLDEEILMVLTATVAAFLGKTARIRRARLLSTGASSNPWGQQGRVYVQGSHNLGARG